MIYALFSESNKKWLSRQARILTEPSVVVQSQILSLIFFSPVSGNTLEFQHDLQPPGGCLLLRIPNCLQSKLVLCYY